LIVVPTLNEQVNVEPALRRITACLPQADVLVVDDDSGDGTWQTVERLRAELPVVNLLVRRGRTPGLGPSVRDGYRYALDHGYEAVCVVDCDLQQDPADVARLRRAHPEADLVIGSRHLHGGAFVRGYGRPGKWTSCLANGALRLLFRFPFRDATTDFALVRTRVLRAVQPESLLAHGYAIFFELKVRAWQAGFRVAEEAVPTYGRAAGSSHRTWRQVYRFAREVLALWVRLFLSSGAATSGEEAYAVERAVRHGPVPPQPRRAG
jgi:glycosyltransferase involved in cell wall biosynthesis